MSVNITQNNLYYIRMNTDGIKLYISKFKLLKIKYLYITH